MSAWPSRPEKCALSRGEPPSAVPAMLPRCISHLALASNDCRGCPACLCRASRRPQEPLRPGDLAGRSGVPESRQIDPDGHGPRLVLEPVFCAPRSLAGGGRQPAHSHQIVGTMGGPASRRACHEGESRFDGPLPAPACLVPAAALPRDTQLACVSSTHAFPFAVVPMHMGGTVEALDETGFAPCRPDTRDLPTRPAGPSSATQ